MKWKSRGLPRRWRRISLRLAIAARRRAVAGRMRTRLLMRSAVAVHAIFAPVGIPPRGRRRARVARIGTGTATHVLRTVTGCRAIDETLHAVAQLLHLAGEHHHLMAKFFHSRRAAPRSVGHRAGPGGAVGRLRTVTDRRAARFRARGCAPRRGDRLRAFQDGGSKVPGRPVAGGGLLHGGHRASAAQAGGFPRGGRRAWVARAADLLRGGHRARGPRGGGLLRGGSQAGVVRAGGSRSGGPRGFHGDDQLRGAAGLAIGNSRHP